MCSYCGCQSIPVIGRFMAEHVDLVNLSGQLRHAVRDGDRAAAGQYAARLGLLLRGHTDAEEAGLFSVMREQEEFTEHIAMLCGEHHTLDDLLAAVVAGDDDQMHALDDLLRRHIDKEDNGLFPASAIALDGPAWERVDATTPEAPAPEARTPEAPVSPAP